MFDTITLLVDLGQKLTLFFTLVVIYGFSLRKLRDVPKGPRVLLGGTVFGIVAAFGMLMPFEALPGVQFDARDIVVMLASPFIGGAASLVAGLVAGAMRLYIGGIGAPAGISDIAVVAVVGVVYAANWSPGPSRIGFGHLLLLSLGPILCLLFIPLTVPQVTLGHFLGFVWPVVVQLVVGTVVLGLLLAREARRLETEDALIESESRFRQSFEASGVAMNVAGLDGTLLAVNPAMCRMLGYTERDLMGVNIAEITHPDDQDATARDRAMLIKRELPAHRVEKRYLHKGGNVVWGLLSRALVEDSGRRPLYTVGHVQDITDKKRAEEALHEARAELEQRVEDRTRDLRNQIAEREAIERTLRKSRQLETLLRENAEAANNARSVRDAVRASLNDVCRATGWPVGNAYLWHDERPPRRLSSSLLHFRDAVMYADVRAAIEGAALDTRAERVRTVLQTGHPLWARIDVGPKAPPRDRALVVRGLSHALLLPVMVRGRAAALLEFFPDDAVRPDDGLLRVLGQVGTQLGRVIERERASQQLREAIVEAEAANRTKSEFLANMSHELRSPLTAVLGYTEAMQQELFGPIGNEKYEEYVGYVLSAGRHLHELINDILDVSAVESGQLTLHEEAVELDSLFESALRIVKPRAMQNGIQIRTTDLTQSPVLMADARRMKQVLVNLLSNAVKFTPSSGSVAIAADIDGGGLLITVADNGIGMDADGIATAMTKFGQVDSGLARQHEGTGLGLPLAKGLVEAHGGTLEIESRVGEGTTVRVRLPETRLIH